MHSEPACDGVWIEGRDSSSQNQQRPAKSEQTEVAEGGQIPFWGYREMEEARGMRWCFGGEEVGVSDSSPPLPGTTSRASHIQINTKPVGRKEGRQIRRRQGGKSQTGGWLLSYTEAYLGSRAGPGGAKQAVTDL